MDQLPGTHISLTPGQNKTGLQFLQGFFSVTSGMMLSQVRELTGMDAPALQNWVKRGWVSSPVGKRYNIDQVARILIINMLRDVMQLEKVVFLMAYINGSADDRSDDIIPESKLYDYICKIIEAWEALPCPEDSLMESVISAQTADYVENLEGAKEKLHSALKVILLAYLSAKRKKQAEAALEQLRKTPQEEESL